MTKEKKTSEKTTKNLKTSIKEKMNKKIIKGFTLIELLAVIIILGVLMLIAIPSVTRYISDSRKNVYATNAKKYSNSAANKVNSMDFPIIDPNTTYYIPSQCIEMDKKTQSPYGEFVDSYVVITFTGESYNYYWTSKDTKDFGITLKYSDSIVKEDVKPNADDVRTDIGVGTRTNITVLGDDCDFANATESTPSKNIQEKGDLEGPSIVIEEQPGEFSTVRYIEDFKWLYPSLAASNGLSKELVAPAEVLLKSSGMKFFYGPAYADEMIGQNVEIAFDVFRDLPSRGSIPGVFIQLRKYQSGEIPGKSDKQLAENYDFFGVIYDGKVLKIVKSTNRDLDPPLVTSDVPESILGSYYNVSVKTIGDTIYAELRDENGLLVKSLTHTSAEFGKQAGRVNAVSYNGNAQLRKISARRLPDTYVPVSQKEINIIAFGDSNTYGNSLPDDKRAEQSWPGQINKIAEEAGMNVTSINKGTTYHRSADLLARISKDVYANKVEGARNILVVYIGTNDFHNAFDNYSSQLSTLKNNIEAIRLGAESHGFEVWIVTFPICADDNGPGQGRNPGLRAFNDWLVNDYAKIQKKVSVIIDYAKEAQHPDLPDKLKPEHLASDGLHASAYGHTWIAKEILRNIK